MIIIKLQFKFREDLPYEDLKIQSGTGTFEENTSDSAQGEITTSEVKVYLPESYPDQYKTLVQQLLRAGAIFAVTVNGDTTFQLGSNELRTQFIYKQFKAGKPGSKNGYDITITYKSLNGCKVIVL